MASELVRAGLWDPHLFAPWEICWQRPLFLRGYSLEAPSVPGKKPEVSQEARPRTDTWFALQENASLPQQDTPHFPEREMPTHRKGPYAVRKGNWFSLLDHRAASCPLEPSGMCIPEMARVCLHPPSSVPLSHVLIELSMGSDHSMSFQAASSASIRGSRWLWLQDSHCCPFLSPAPSKHPSSTLRPLTRECPLRWKARQALPDVPIS